MLPMQFLRSAVAVWLLIAFSACYAFPAVTASTARTKNCCPSGGRHSCCRKSAASAGSFWTATPECGQACRMPASLSVQTSATLAPFTAQVGAAVLSTELHLTADTRSALRSYFAFLYQRPPPPSSF
jgi:hypothetical protein